MSSTDAKLRLFLHHSTAAKDVALVGELLRHLRPRFANVEPWHQTRIQPGDDRRQAITRAIQEADIALLLLSADYLAHDTMQDVELPQMLERRHAGHLRVIPVLLRPCGWKAHSDLTELQILPRDEEPIGGRDDNGREQALTDIVKEIRQLAPEPTVRTYGPQNISERAAATKKTSTSQQNDAARSMIVRDNWDDGIEQPDKAAWIVRQRLARTPIFRAEYVIYPGLQDAHGEVLASYLWTSIDSAGWCLLFVSAYWFFNTNKAPEDVVLLLLALASLPLGLRRMLVASGLRDKIGAGILAAILAPGWSILVALLLDSLGLMGWRHLGLGVAGGALMALSAVGFSRVVPGVGGHLVSHLWINKATERVTDDRR